MGKIKAFFTILWVMICQWKVAIISAVIVFALALSLLAIVRGQQNVGAFEAGNQVTILAKNICGAYKMRPDFWGLSTQEVIDQKLYPADMRVENGKLKGYFANDVEIGADESGMAVMPSMRSFVIAYNGLNKKQCVALASHQFEHDFWLSVSELTIKSNKSEQVFSWSSEEFALPAERKVVTKICDDVNKVIFRFEQ